MPFFSAGGGEWDSAAGAADNLTNGFDAGVNGGGDFGATNGDVTRDGGQTGGDFTCRRQVIQAWHHMLSIRC